MNQPSRFRMIEGQPDEDEVLQWVETYFFGLMNMFNVFFVRNDLADTISRMEDIPFEQMMIDELKDEDRGTIDLAREKLKELIDVELSTMRAYAKK